MGDEFEKLKQLVLWEIHATKNVSRQNGLEYALNLINSATPSIKAQILRENPLNGLNFNQVSDTQALLNEKTHTMLTPTKDAVDYKESLLEVCIIFAMERKRRFEEMKQSSKKSKEN